MKNQNWTFLLVVIMGAIALLVTGSTIFLLYNTAIDQQKTRLVEIAQTQAKLIEAVARFDAAHEKTYPGIHPEGSAAATISQIIDAHKHYKGFGKTGEFTLSRKEGDYIVFILNHRRFDFDQPNPVPWNSSLAEPMRLALSGKSGTIIGLDYSGEKVLAAFEPVEVLNLGIVAKIDLSEIRSPFIKAGLFTIFVSVLAIITGIVLFGRITSPVLKKIQENSQVQLALNKSLNKEIEIRKMIEKDLIRNQSFLQKAQEIGKIGAWELDVKKNKLLWTDQVYKIFGLPTGTELTYDTFINCVYPDDREYVHTKWIESLKKKPYDIEHRLLVDGKMKWVREKAELEFNQNDECIQGIGITQDITERKQAEEQYRTILQTSIDGFCITDIHGCFMEINDAYCALIGYSRNELVNMSISDIEACETAEDTARHIQTIMETGYDRFETQHRSKKGNLIDIEVNTAFLPVDAGRLFAFFRDITEQKNSEAVLQKAHEDLEMRVYERTKELARANKMLDALNAAQSMFISDTDPKIMFDGVLHNILALTGSQYGFVGEVFFDDQGAPYLKVHAISDISWDEKSKTHYELHAPEGMEFRNLKSLYGAILTSGQPVIANDPANDPRSGGLPEGHPRLDAFLGIPLAKGEKLVGGIGIANRAEGYDEDLVNYLEPLVASCASIVEAYRSDQDRKLAVAEINRNYNIQSALSDILRTSLEEIPLEEILSAILKKILNIPWFAFGKKGGIFLVEDDPDVLVLKAHNNFSKEALKACRRVPAGKCHCGKVLQTRKIVFSNHVDADHEIRYEGMSAHGDYCVPIIVQDTVMGVLNVHVKEGHQNDSREEKFLILVANTIAAIVVRKKAEESLKHYSEDLEQKVAMRTRDLEASKLEAEAATLAKSDFLASMSHELRTPLNAIIGFSQVLQAHYFGTLSEKQSEYVADILESGRHLLSLINDILDLSKVEAGKMELALSRVNLENLLKNSLVMIKEKAHLHGIALDLNLPASLKGVEIDADERKLKQILFNFLSNAAKFTPDGGKIEVSARLVDAHNKAVEPGTNEEIFVEICVSDTGIGIAAEDQARVFEPFIQVKGGITDKTAGTGLGLSLTKEFAALHNGRVWVESEGPGKGSRFYVQLPAGK
ncbi:MAG: GAF domain-containing protein [Deltaproteobacteria bacterium]|uniref:GAF domain-containing protein n=1 Tax=Desulfobacula sp. TaxID=2593537 RepID=UPI0019CB4180|nr:GAF domain-containing protein [Candidatus Desulfobacula maris]MBL6995457.1 GAF domain-containing protein [Desulfobacula sp.]